MEVAGCVMSSNDNQMMRVAYLFPRGDVGGAEIATIRFIEGHDRSKVTPFAFFMENGPAVDRVRALGVVADVAPFLPRLSRPRELRQGRAWITERLRHHSIDLQHSVMSWTHALGGAAARRAGAKVIWFQHNRPNKADLVDWYASLSHADLILTNSRFVAKLQESVNLRRFPIEIVHLPVPRVGDVQRSPAIRAELGADDSHVLAVLAGRLLHFKGQDIAIRALALAADRAPNLRLAIVGGALFGLETDYPKKLEQLAHRAGVADRIRFVGFREDMNGIYASADIVLNTSRMPEAFGLVVAEGLVHGRAVIACNAGGVTEQIEHERTGVLVKPEDPAALASALVRVATDPEFRRRLGTAALGAPIPTLRSAAAQLESLYERTLASKT